MKAILMLLSVVFFASFVFFVWVDFNTKEYSCVLITKTDKTEQASIVNIRDKTISFSHDAYGMWTDSAFMFEEKVNEQTILRGSDDKREYARAFINNKISFMVIDNERKSTLYIGHCKENS